MSAAEPLVLGIETSCDETGIGIVRGRTLLSNTIASSMDEHAVFRFGHDGRVLIDGGQHAGDR